MEHQPSTSTTKNGRLHPLIPNDSFPVVLTVSHGDSPSPNVEASGHRSGDLYLGPNTIWIIQSARWTLWTPSTALLLDIDGEELYTSPCAEQGLRLVESEDGNADQVKSMRCDLKLGNQDDLTATVLQRIRTAAQIDVPMAGRSVAQDPIPTAQLPHVEKPKDKRPGGRQLRVAPREPKAEAKVKVGKAPERAARAVKAEKAAGKASGSEGRKRKAQHSADTDTNTTDTQGDSLLVDQDQVLPKRRRPTPKFQSLITGITCPPDAPTIEWPLLGVTTYGPWFSDKDLDAVRKISQAPRAQDTLYGPGRPMIVEFAYDARDARALLTLPSKIQESLSKGCAVLVRGWEPNPVLEFSAEAIQLYRPTLNQMVVVQDATKRGREQRKGKKGDISQIHSTLTMERFIALAEDPNECLNLLDLPNLQPDVPIFLRPLSDNVNARSATMNEVHLAKTGDNAGKEYTGVQTILADTERVRGWDLMTHGGFLTYAHHDACGFSTYTTVRSGSKIWVYVDTDGSADADRKSLYRDWDGLFLEGLEGRLTDGPFGAVVLERGDTLIQPPGVAHVVYTPQNGLTSGGHFMSYATMHLTELAFRYDSRQIPGEEGMEAFRIATNSEHPSILRYVTWMVLGLPVLAQDKSRAFYRRSTLALIVLMQHAQDYMTLEFMETAPTILQEDIMMREMQGERTAAMKIVDKLKDGLKITDAAVELQKGHWWDPGPECSLAKILSVLLS